MKSLLLALMMALPFAAQAAVIEEEIFVIGEHPELVRELSQYKQFTVDHIHSEGFEVYGPKGLHTFLQEKNVLFYDMKAANKQKIQDADYPTYEQIKAKLESLATRFPSIVSLSSIGKTVRGRDLLMLKISDNVNVDEVEPEFKYISSMHGDEIVGRELTIALLEEILPKYGVDERITKLIDNTEIFVMPSMNPDGSELRRRGNGNNVDVNRDFPEFVDNDQNTPDGRQPETRAVMAFQAQHNIAMSANFHGGAVVVNYPWDSRYERHPLDAMLQELAVEYSRLNGPMANSREFNRGITNGADWYIVKGGMQDWSYIWHNDLQVTIELSDTKWPSYSQIPNFYRDNRDAMLRYLELVHQGAGFKLSNSLATGTVEIKDGAGRSLGSYGFQRGEFYKVLPVGGYVFTIKTGGTSVNVNVIVDGSVDSNGNYTVL